jgi:hypothetical protein
LDQLKQVCGFEYFRPQSAADVQHVVKGLVDQLVGLERRQRVDVRLPQELFHRAWTEVQGEHQKRQTCHTGEQWAFEYRTALEEAANFRALYRSLLLYCRTAPGASQDPFQVNSDLDCEQFIRLLIHEGLSARALARQPSTQQPSEHQEVTHPLPQEPAEDTVVTGPTAQLPDESKEVTHLLAEETADDSQSLAAEAVFEGTSVDEAAPSSVGELTEAPPSSPTPLTEGGDLTEAQLGSVTAPQIEGGDLPEAQLGRAAPPPTEGSRLAEARPSDHVSPLTAGEGQSTTPTDLRDQLGSQSDFGGYAPTRTTYSPSRYSPSPPAQPYRRFGTTQCFVCRYDSWGSVTKRCGVCCGFQKPPTPSGHPTAGLASTPTGPLFPAVQPPALHPAPNPWATYRVPTAETPSPLPPLPQAPASGATVAQGGKPLGVDTCQSNSGIQWTQGCFSTGPPSSPFPYVDYRPALPPRGLQWGRPLTSATCDQPTRGRQGQPDRSNPEDPSPGAPTTGPSLSQGPPAGRPSWERIPRSYISGVAAANATEWKKYNIPCRDFWKRRWAINSFDDECPRTLAGETCRFSHHPRFEQWAKEEQYPSTLARLREQQLEEQLANQTTHIRVNVADGRAVNIGHIRIDPSSSRTGTPAPSRVGQSACHTPGPRPDSDPCVGRPPLDTADLVAALHRRLQADFGKPATPTVEAPVPAPTREWEDQFSQWQRNPPADPTPTPPDTLPLQLPRPKSTAP